VGQPFHLSRRGLHHLAEDGGRNAIAAGNPRHRRGGGQGNPGSRARRCWHCAPHQGIGGRLPRRGAAASSRKQAEAHLAVEGTYTPRRFVADELRQVRAPPTRCRLGCRARGDTGMRPPGSPAITRLSDRRSPAWISPLAITMPPPSFSVAVSNCIACNGRTPPASAAARTRVRARERGATSLPAASLRSKHRCAAD